jgi:DNA repair exonuclease SbcCD ATPase subunit
MTPRLLSREELDAGLEDLANVCLRGDLASEIRDHIAALEADLEAHREANATASCAFCEWRQTIPGGQDARKAALVAHVKECQKHPMRALEAQQQYLGGTIEVLQAREQALEASLAEAQRTADSFIQEAGRSAKAAEERGRLFREEAKKREAAEADNAALTAAIQRMRNLLLFPAMNEADTRMEVLRIGLDAVTHPCPGAALLEEHRKTLIRARNEGLEKAAQAVGLSGAEMSNARERRVTAAIRAMKDPEHEG